MTQSEAGASSPIPNVYFFQKQFRINLSGGGKKKTCGLGWGKLPRLIAEGEYVPSSPCRHIVGGGSGRTNSGALKIRKGISIDSGSSLNQTCCLATDIV